MDLLAPLKGQRRLVASKTRRVPPRSVLTLTFVFLVLPLRAQDEDVVRLVLHELATESDGAPGFGKTA